MCECRKAHLLCLNDCVPFEAKHFFILFLQHTEATWASGQLYFVGRFGIRQKLIRRTGSISARET
jgi:hypothetical protein